MAGRILVLGYGNVDRQDDGVAWHILNSIAGYFGIPVPDPSGEGIEVLNPELPTDVSSDTPVGFSEKLPIDLAFALQLTPEMAESLATYSVVCFVDAHTGNVPHEVNFEEMRGAYQASPFTHHLTPQTCLSLAQALYGHSPKGFLMSIRGYEFGFTNELSEKTKQLSTTAGQQLVAWLQLLEG
jgi:Ni,Fe-hydrogenase maturation factor